MPPRFVDSRELTAAHREDLKERGSIAGRFAGGCVMLFDRRPISHERLKLRQSEPHLGDRSKPDTCRSCDSG